MLERFFEEITRFGVRFIAAAVILIVGIKVSKWFSSRLPRTKGFMRLDSGVSKFAANVIKAALYTLTIITAAGTLGIPYASFVALLGSAGVAIGLALQGSLSNIASGILILVNKPFKVGDYIETSDVAGTVSEIGFFSTTVVTPDNRVVSYPNSMLSNTCITNYSVKSERRLEVKVGVAYGSDIDKVKNVLEQAAAANEYVLAEPKPFAGICNHADSAIEFALLVWCKRENYLSLFYSLREDITKAFEQSGIEIPYNTLDVNVRK